MAKTEAHNGRLADEEGELDRRIREVWGDGPEDNPPEQWAAMREQSRLSLLYPGLFVAYRDHGQVEGKQLRLLRREVLCVATTLEGLHERLDQIVRQEEPDIQVAYVDPPDSLPWL